MGLSLQQQVTCSLDLQRPAPLNQALPSLLLMKEEIAGRENAVLHPANNDAGFFLKGNQGGGGRR